MLWNEKENNQFDTEYFSEYSNKLKHNRIVSSKHYLIFHAKNIPTVL